MEQITPAPAEMDRNDIRYKRMIGQYRASGIDIREEQGDIIIAEQVRVSGGYIMTNRELYDRARTVYPEKRYKIKPVIYRLSLCDITPEWIGQRMKEFDINTKTIIAQTGLTASEVSLIVNGKRPMTRTTRAMFYYFFLTYQLNRDLRQPPISSEELAEAIQRVQADRLKGEE